jgi:hypothetical protein
MISLTVNSSRLDEVFGKDSCLKALSIPTSLKASVREYLLYCYRLDGAANTNKVKIGGVQMSGLMFMCAPFMTGLLWALGLQLAVFPITQGSVSPFTRVRNGAPLLTVVLKG